MPQPSVGHQTARPSVTRWVRAAAVMAAVSALIVGALPGQAPAPADAATATFGDFSTSVDINQSGSDLRPGGHVRYSIRATNTLPRGWVGDRWNTTTVALLLYGLTPPSELTYRSASGLYSPGNWGQSGNFIGGLSGPLQNVNSISDLYSNIYQMQPAFVEGQQSRFGSITLNIPENARGGTMYRVGMRMMQARIRYDQTPYPSSITHPTLGTFTLGAVSTETLLSTMPEAAVVGEPVELKATVSAAAGSNMPAGTVTFTVAGEPRTVPVVDGVASTTMTFDSAGSEPVIARFDPEVPTQFGTSTAETAITVTSGFLGTGPPATADGSSDWFAVLNSGSLSALVGSTKPSH